MKWVYLGANYVNGQWKWLDGTPVESSLWYPNNPAERSPVEGPCGEWRRDEYFDDEECDTSEAFVCAL